MIDNINYLYLLSFILSGFILYIVMNDINKINTYKYISLNNDIKSNYNIWVKMYCIISIIFIHLIWLFFVLLLNYDDKYYIYALPYYLLIPYIIYFINVSTEKKDTNELDTSYYVNMYLNYLALAYFIIILIVIAIPNKFKKNIINFIKLFIGHILLKYGE